MTWENNDDGCYERPVREAEYIVRWRDHGQRYTFQAM